MAFTAADTVMYPDFFAAVGSVIPLLPQAVTRMRLPATRTRLAIVENGFMGLGQGVRYAAYRVTALQWMSTSYAEPDHSTFQTIPPRNGGAHSERQAPDISRR